MHAMNQTPGPGCGSRVKAGYTTGARSSRAAP